jgi:adenylate kinase family enzyme
MDEQAKEQLINDLQTAQQQVSALLLSVANDQDWHIDPDHSSLCSVTISAGESLHDRDSNTTMEGQDAVQRIVIIGNSGSGKSYLARQLGQRLSITPTHLDELFWEPGGFNQKRPQEVLSHDIEAINTNARWIVEGVFGELAVRFLDKAECLIWLDMDWGCCLSNLLQRGSESSKQFDKAEAEVNFRKLLAWASKYWERDNLRSYKGHQELFDSFKGHKRVLRSRDEVDLLVSDPPILETRGDL